MHYPNIHGISIIQKKKYMKSSLSNSDYCKCFPKPSNNEMANIRKYDTKKYKRPINDPQICLNKEYNVEKRN